MKIDNTSITKFAIYFDKKLNLEDNNFKSLMDLLYRFITFYLNTRI